MSDEDYKAKGYHSKSEMRRMEIQKPDEQRQEGPPREWWLREWIDSQPDGFLSGNVKDEPAYDVYTSTEPDTIHVISYDAYRAKCEELAKFAYEEGLRFGEVVKQLIAAKAEIAELKKLTEGMVSSKPPYLEKYEAERARVTRLRSALEKITHDHECMECCMVAFEALKQDGGENG